MRSFVIRLKECLKLKLGYLVLLCGLLFSAPAISAELSAKSIRESAELLHLIRREKLDLILPEAMRGNGVDMWIHIIRDGDSDPMAVHFGDVSGYVIFTDRGGDRIERAVFGEGGHPDLFDIHGSDRIARAISGYDYGRQDTDIFKEISEYIAERDPRKIAVNYSDWLAISDGISHTQYVRLEKILGAKYAARMVSAENVITDFRVRRVQREVVEFSNALEMHRHILERALSGEVITPGETTLGDVGWWVAEEKRRLGLAGGISPGVSIPRILYSAVSEPIDAPDVRWWIHHEDYVIQRGDFMTFDISVRYLDYFTTDFKRNAYVLRDNETSVPDSIQRAFDRAITAHKIMRPHIVAGRTARETLASLVGALEAAGYVYTPFIDIGIEDYRLVQQVLADTDQPGFSIDLHAVGNNGGSLVTLGASVAPFRTDRFDLTIQENHLFSFEYMVHSQLPERPGFPISINIEGNHIVTGRGVEYLHPPNERILIIQ